MAALSSIVRLVLPAVHGLNASLNSSRLGTCIGSGTRDRPDRGQHDFHVGGMGEKWPALDRGR